MAEESRTYTFPEGASVEELKNVLEMISAAGYRDYWIDSTKGVMHQRVKKITFFKERKS